MAENRAAYDEPALIGEIFARYGISGPWTALPATGVANRIFATRDTVLRIASDHPESVSDARTESVAAPVAYAAGILTPRMIAFDDTRTLLDRPFSLWERVHGETLGLAKLTCDQAADLWRNVGGELAKLHLRVRDCLDPHGYLDQPRRHHDIGSTLRRLVEARKLEPQIAERVHRLAELLRLSVGEPHQNCFIHDDIHPMNIMCSADGKLLAILDWGDAGWGDPSLDFAGMPFEAIPSALAGYEAHAPGLLGATPTAQIAWNKLLDATEDVWEDDGASLDVEAFWRFATGDV